MRAFRLIRMAEGPDYTLGRIEDEEHNVVCVTCERAWVDTNGDGLGDRNESRIPAGSYLCQRDLHGKSGPDPYECWEIQNVPGRSEIHIHIGNSRADSKGCPLVGTAFGPNGTITESRKAFQKWMKLTAGEDRIHLIVEDITP